jgi:formylglycine-generating enzyme required for sulfatase activity
MFDRFCRIVLAVAVAAFAVSTASAADKDRTLAVSKAAPANEARVALVIGNSTYKEAPLRNPVNDAQDIAKELSRLGFKVTLKENADQKTMKQVIREFGNHLKRGGVGLFYFAGHGMQVKGRNYLVPVGVDIQSEDEVEDQSVDVNLVLEKMESAGNRVNVVVLDACRNNPFARRFRSAARGLAQMDAAKGSYIAYATAPGSVAADGSGRNGVYTKHLLASLRQPESDIEKVFKRVRANVARETGNKQIPWESSSLIGDFYFNPSAKPGQAATADPAAIELAYWQSIEDSTNAEDYKGYLKKYPNGQFADLAKRRALNPPKPATAAVASIAPLQATKPKPEPSIAGKAWTEPTTGMEFVWIPKGCFQMGSPGSEKDRMPDERRHEACVDGFWMGKYEVTNAQYKQYKPDHGADDKYPVTDVSWQEAVRFAQWLSEKSGKKLRLPTEAEWEYAARAGTSTAYFWGDGWESRHNYLSDSKKPVGSHQPNAFGLHDMLGNVREWTASSYDSNYGGAERQVASLDAGGHRVSRGGAWLTPPEVRARGDPLQRPARLPQPLLRPPPLQDSLTLFPLSFYPFRVFSRASGG